MKGIDSKKFERKRVFITGGTGFIGSHLLKRLVKLKSDVYALVRPGSDTSRIADFLNKVHVIDCDIEDSSLKKEVQKIEPEIIFHLAAYVNRDRSFEVANRCMKTNVNGTINLLRSLENTAYERFVNTGTCEEYGNIKAPFREDYLVKPVSPYSISKTASVLFCETYHKIYGFPIVNLRPFLTYGPFQDEKMFIPEMIISCLRGKNFEMTAGRQGRDPNYVDDIVNGYLKAAHVKGAVGEIINLGSGKEYTIKEMAEMINNLTGKPIKILAGKKPYREAEIWHLYCSNVKAKRILGWSPKVGLKEGLAKTINWYKQNLE
jgi:nucleoside-diphosphate-sugar epimerase